MKDQIIDFIQDWTIYSRLGNFLRKVGRFLQRLCFWIPTIWKDEDWDCCFLYRMMELKIQRLRKNIDTNGRHLSAKKDVKNMLVAEELLRRMAGYSFYDYNAPVEFCTCPKGECFFSERYMTKRPDGLKVWNYPWCGYCTKGKGLHKVYEKEKADADYLWYLMKRESRRWWD